MVTEMKLEPGRCVMLLDIDVARATTPEGAIAAACGIRKESAAADAMRFRASGIAGSRAVVCVATKGVRGASPGGKPWTRHHGGLNGVLSPGSRTTRQGRTWRSFTDYAAHR